MDRDNSFRTTASPLALLQRLVPAARKEQRLEPNDVLRGLVPSHHEGAETAGRANAPVTTGLEAGVDPQRQAAMNQIRRMRIRAA